MGVLAGFEGFLITFICLGRDPAPYIICLIAPIEFGVIQGPPARALPLWPNSSCPATFRFGVVRASPTQDLLTAINDPDNDDFCKYWAKQHTDLVLSKMKTIHFNRKAFKTTILDTYSEAEEVVRPTGTFYTNKDVCVMLFVAVFGNQYKSNDL